MENPVAAEVIAAFQEGSQAQLGAVAAILVRPGAASQFASYLKTNGASKDAARLVDKCLQALRRGTVVIADALQQPGAAAAPHPHHDEDAEAGEVLQRLRDGAIAGLYRAALGVMGGDGEDAELGGYPHVLLDHLDALGFQPLTLVLSDVCRGVEARSRGAPRLLSLLPKAAGLLVAKAAPEDEAEEEAMEDNGAGAGTAAGRRGGPGAPSAAAQHVATALHRLTHAEWAPEHAVAIMDALREIRMTPAQQQAVITKALSVCGATAGGGGDGGGDLAALPGLLRQLMRLAGPGHRAMVLRGVLALFDRLEAAHRRAPAAAAAAGPAAAMGPPAAAGAGGLVAAGGISGALAAVEGTALVTLADAFKYDGVLAKELIKLVECSPSAPSRFCLLLLFTLSQQHKQEGPVRNLLKHLVSAGFQWDATRAASAWLSSLPALPRPGGQQLRAALLAAVRTSGVGGEVVVPGIVALGAALLGCCPPAEALALVQRNEAALAAAAAAPGGGGGGGGAAAAAAAEAAAGGLQGRGSAGLQSALLGIELLQAAFEAHVEARGPVLRLCQEALGGTSGGGTAAAGSGGGGGEAALAAVLLLGNLVARCPALLYEHTPKLKDALQSFLLLPAPVALGLLLALWPLAAGTARGPHNPHLHGGGGGGGGGGGRRDLRDYAVMLLRKVMFAREAASRLVAVRGFLFILLQQLEAQVAAAGGAAAGAAAGQDEDERLEAAAAAAAAAAGPSFSQASASQSCMSQMSALASGGGVSLQHELQGFLRRALGQQAGVRAALYGGLGQVLEVDAGSRDIVLELVGPQLQRYLAPPPAMPPLNTRLLVSGGNSGSGGGCNDGGGGCVSLLEPLPSLLDAARKLVFLSREPGEGPAWLQEQEGGGGEGDAIMVDEEEEEAGGDVADDASVQALVRGWDSFARRLTRCHAEHFDLNTAAELNPGTAAGAARQLQAVCLLGAIEVVMQELVHVATGPGGNDSAAASGDRLTRLFELHCRIHDLAREAKATPAGGRGKNAAAATEAGGGGDSAHVGSDGATTAVGVVGPGTGTAPPGAAAPGALKRPRELLCPDLVPADARPPALSWGCLGRLCGGVQRDGLAHDMRDEPGAGPSAHTRLARSPLFRAFVLRSCHNRLRAAAGASSTSSAAASSSGGALADALVACAQRRQARRAQRVEERSGGGSGLGGGAGPAAAAGGGGALEAPWQKMAQPLVLLCQMLLSTWTGPTKRPPAPRKAGGGGGPQAEAEARAARREAAAADSLAGLAVGCLRELLGGAAALGGLRLVAWVLRGLPIHCQDTQAQVDETFLPPAEVVVARLPHFADMLTALMGAGSFKEAAALVEVVVGLARLLPPAAQLSVSDVLWERLHQTEPRVKYAPLVRALLSAHVGLRGSEDATALKAVALSVQAIIGAVGVATQEEPSAPGALHQETGQYAALEVLQLLGQGLAQAEEALAAATRVAAGGGGSGDGEPAPSGSGAGAGGATGTGRGGRGGGGSGGGRPGSGAAASRVLVQLSEAVGRRLVRLLDVLNVVVNTRLAFPQVLEAQTEVVIRAFKLLGALAKIYLPAKGAAAASAPAAPPISKTFQDLVAQVHRDLTPSVYAAMHDDVGVGATAAAAGAEGDEAGGASKQLRAKAKRDSKAYSQLVFALEDFEKQLLALDKVFKSSGINLMKGAKRSTNRDFAFTGGAAGGTRRGDTTAMGGDQMDRHEGA